MTSLEDIEIGCCVVVLIVCLLCCFTLYFLGNHQGGLGVAVLALLIVLLPTIVVVLSSVSYLPYIKTFPPYTVPVVSLLISILVLVVTARMSTVYWNKYRPTMIANIVINTAGFLTCICLLIVVQVLFRDACPDDHHEKIA